MNLKHKQSCRICENKHLIPVIDLGSQYFQGAFSKEGVPVSYRKTPNLLVRCDVSKNENACGLIQTAHTVPAEILYSNYWYQSGISLTMRNHLKSITEEALKITDLNKGKVLDIASNDNTLLRNYPPSFEKVGVDPSDIAGRQTDLDIKIYNETFPSKVLKEQTTKTDLFDIVTSIACFYDIENPKNFAREVADILKEDGVWIFEVAYWPSMIEKLAYDSIVNEHVIHYHLAPLEVMFAPLGLKIFDARLTDTNGGSIMVYVCKDTCLKYDTQERKKRLTKLRLYEFNLALDEEEIYETFREKVKERKDELLDLLNGLKKENKKVHIYGASTKLNSILGYCGIDSSLIEYAAERSPEKVGAKTISGIKIISEEESRAMKPDYYLVGPYHFKSEILERESEIRKAGVKFIFPLPNVTVV